MSTSRGSYTREQRLAVRAATRRGREAMQRAERYEPLVFARAFVEHGGVQIPGSDDRRAATEVGRRLLEALEQGRSADPDPHVHYEMHRARQEAAWARAARSEKVVGFRLELGPRSENHPGVLALLGEDHGLGAGVFPKTHTLVMPADCDDYRYVPVVEDEVEQ